MVTFMQRQRAVAANSIDLRLIVNLEEGSNRCLVFRFLAGIKLSLDNIPRRAWISYEHLAPADMIVTEFKNMPASEDLSTVDRPRLFKQGAESSPQGQRTPYSRSGS